jgi:hypothetical protein
MSQYLIIIITIIAAAAVARKRIIDLHQAIEYQIVIITISKFATPDHQSVLSSLV